MSAALPDRTPPVNEQADRLHKFAHDMRNRLSGLYEALKQMAQSDDAERLELLEYGERQFFRALREMEVLLDDLGVDRSVQRIRPTPITLAPLVRKAIAQLQHRFEGKDQHVVEHLEEKLTVAGDERHLLEAITTLLSNASKFSPHGTSIELRSAIGDGQAELCVIDQGVGLNEEDLRNIFTRYAWLGSRSTNGEAQGRNNLSRAHGWINAMGGTIEANSEGEGKGCAFTLRLPLAP